MNDLISREAALDELNQLSQDNFTVDDWFHTYNAALIDADGKIRELPSAQPQKMKGKWIDCKSSPHWKCSHCGYRAPYFGFEPDDMSEWLSEFCPHCGADMRGEQE